jgi:hypothetical protein
MMTSLPVGTYFRFAYKGEQDYGLVSGAGETYQLLADSQVPVRATVHRCVWTGPKRMRLESRGTEIKK